ncbi:monocarboxylate transporter 12-B-like isoform X2 [Mugil cephalus]|uniref:monocarboxylate transporter 12-B-like isoform X2 n=1 Tax=Mugil cephalus TaxID=48193 RepID=UPI001FB6B6B0|nr:monocarboxylate transporter 12-B-like isoform X2 [Mugil cephalus]
MARAMAVSEEERIKGGRRLKTTLPEGGWGWMIVASCFLATICIRAVTRCVSMFFVEFQMHFEKDYSTTAWIHSLIDSTTMLCAPLGSFLGNRLSCRATVVLGGLLSSAGLILSSFATSLEYLYTSMGVLTGSGIGTFLLAPAVQLLIEYYTWRGALLILGGFVSNLCVCGVLMRPLETRGGERTWENKMANLEKDCITTTLDTTKETSTDCSQVETKQLGINNLKDTQGLLITNGIFKNFRFDTDKLSQGNMALLPNPRQPDPDLKLAECILFSNKLTKTVLGEIEFSALSNSSTTDNLKLMENTKPNKLADVDAKIDDSGPTDDSHKTIPPQTLLKTRPSSRGQCFCLESMEEFGFLVIPNFLILSVSFLFLAYGCSAPVVYLVPYALSVGVEHQHAAFLMSIFGVSSIVGNITFGWITDRKCLKKYRMLSYMAAICMEGLCCVFMPFLHSFSLLVLFSVLYGYFDGAYVALMPVVISDTVGSTYLTSALGVVYFLHGIPYLISPPIGGWLVDQTRSYAATFFLSGASFIFSSVIVASATLVRRCQRSNSVAHLNPSHSAAAAAVLQQGII